MKKTFLFFPLCVSVVTSELLAETKKITTDATPFLGYRQDTVKWNTKSQAGFKWKNLKFIDYGVKANTTFKGKYVIKYELGLSNLLNGHIQDSRYLIPAGPASTSSLKGWGLALRPNLGLGYKFKPNKRFQIIPQLGYSYDLIYVNINKGTGPLSSFKDTMQWHGPWLGFDTTAKLFQRLTLNVGASYHLAFYRANGNWKTPNIATKNTLNQSGTGHGITGRIKLAYEVEKSLSLGAEGDILWRRAKTGNDKRTFANGTTTKSKFKKVEWDSFGGRLTLTKTF